MAWLCIASLHHQHSCFWFCSLWPAANQTRGGVESKHFFANLFLSLFFFKRRIVFTCCSPCMSSAAILFCIYHTLLSLLILLSLTFGRFVLELKQPLSFLETFRRVFISRCYCHENSKRQQINKMNKLNHLNLIVY